MSGQHNSFLQKIRSVQSDQKILDVDVVYPFHLATFCAGKGVKELSVNVDDFVIGICYYFHRSSKRENQLS